MIFTINIDGKPIEFSNALSWQFKYRSQFKEDPTGFIVDALEATTKQKDEQKAYLEAVKVITFGRLANIAWAMAKAADNSVPTPPVWQAQFEKFPVLEIGIECLAYAIQGLTGDSEPKNAEAPEKGEAPANA